MAEIHPGADRPGLLSRKKVGARYEQEARRFLERKGLQFIAANVHVRGGEIDLIMRQHKVTVFVEVRYRSTPLYGGAVASITYAKRRRLLYAARSWLARTAGSFDTVDCRFDVLAFTGNEIEWVTNAFTAED